MLKNLKAQIIKNERIARGIYSMVIICEGADLANFVPGQFANISVPEHKELLLKRPISICETDVEKNTVTLVYQIKGKGTTALADMGKGTVLDAILPIGSGYHLKNSDKKVFLVGGGVGIAPLLSVTRKWADKTYEAFLGYRGKEFEYCLKDFQSVSEKVYVSSDDGTIGEKGFVTDMLKSRLERETPDVILTCGPPPMLKALKKALEPFDIPAQVSMEQRMCCGFGACSGCVCGVQKDEGLEYKKVCVEGPVFDLYEVVL